MKTLITSASLTVLVAAQANAEWAHGVGTDPMTDQVVAVATVRYTDGSYIRYRCEADGSQSIGYSGGEFLPGVAMSSGDLRAAIVYRVDDHEPQRRVWHVRNGTDGAYVDRVSLESTIADFLSARERILVQDALETNEFDASNAAEEITAVRTACGLD